MQETKDLLAAVTAKLELTYATIKDKEDEIFKIERQHGALESDVWRRLKKRKTNIFLT
jgi:hypothetical protein